MSNKAPFAVDAQSLYRSVLIISYPPGWPGDAILAKLHRVGGWPPLEATVCGIYTTAAAAKGAAKLKLRNLAYEWNWALRDDATLKMPLARISVEETPVNWQPVT